MYVYLFMSDIYFTVSFLEMLLAGHQLVAALLDFLIVAQCASLLHKIVISGREVLQMPWVRGWAYVKGINFELYVN